MKKLYSIFIFLFFVTASTFAQERYLDEVFTDVDVQQNVVYGSNGTILFIGTTGEIIEVPLIMDVYTPSGDTETDRPAVLVFHTGNFLPNVVNGQISGTLRDSAQVEICTQLAKRGFVAASVNYRSGWNPLAGSQPERALGLIQAAYRGVQDGRNAIRFMKSSAANFGVDTDNIVVWGNGTGGYLTLGLVGLSDYLEIVQTTNGPGKFLLDADGDGTAETPMVVPAFHGDINGEVLTVVPPPGGFGLPEGDTTNYVNFVGVDNSFALGINVGGALGDISWLNDNTTPTITIQSAFDQFAPYNDGTLIVPTTGDPIVRVQGGQMIGAAQEAAGNNQMWKDANFTDAITDQAIANSATAGHPYYEGLFPWIKPANSLGIDEGVVIDWWDEFDPSPADGPGMGAPWNLIPHPSDPSGATSFHDSGLILNEGMSAEKARANIADVMAYVLPRTCVALDLPCAANFISSTKEPVVDATMEVSPNPSAEAIRITTDNAYQMIDLNVFDMSGKMVKSYQNINTNDYIIYKTDLSAGMYMIKATFEEGVQTQKVIFN